jgi:hypothetical protein
VIHIPNTGHSPGTIIVAAGVTPRYYEFQMSLEGLHVPAGTTLHIERSCDITQNFNKGVRDMVGEWAWFLGDDHSFPPDMLLNLLNYKKDVVVPVTPCKIAPWFPCMMHGPADPERDGFWHEDMLLYHWDEVSGTGIMELPKGDFIGQAGMLVKKTVLNKLGDPWFKCGQLDPGRLQEDLMFCHELQQLGYTVWIYQDVILDHHFIIGVTARRHLGKWVPALRSGANVLTLPDAKPAFDPNTPIPPGAKPLKWGQLPRERDYIKSVEGACDGRPVGV